MSHRERSTAVVLWSEGKTDGLTFVSFFS